MKYITLAAKLPEAVAAAFQTWCKDNGRVPNEMLTYMIECVLKLQRGDSLVNEKLLEVMHVWDMFKDIDRVGSIITGAKLEVVECIYLIQEEGKKGITAILVEPSFFDTPNYSTDKNEILDEVFSATCKSLNSRIRKIGKRLGTESIEETLIAMCEYYEHNEDEIHNEVLELFADNSRHEYGRSTEDILKYKRHNKRSIHEPSQLTFLNDLQRHEQRQELPEDNPERTMAEPEQEDEADGEL